jgi:translation initiation factor IF-2
MNHEKDKKQTKRPPVVAIMGHIDHGKSALLDYIRKTNVVEKEAGGITQHVGAYEVVHTGKDNLEEKITFLDTPGHEAFTAIRQRGADVGDLGVLVVSAEDGVKPQTLEALQCMKGADLPFVVAINKIDKPGADINRTKQDLAENEIFLEGYGGKIPWTAISAKTGEGIPELLDLILLVAELEELKGNVNSPGEGIIIEGHLDAKKGIVATAVIKNGTVRKSEFALSGNSLSPLRILENFLGKPIEEATLSSPIRIIGWDSMPKVGDRFKCFSTKKEAREAMSAIEKETPQALEQAESPENTVVIPVVIKADVTGSLEAIRHEIEKLRSEKVVPKIILSGTGSISENDIKTAGINGNALVIGFHTKIDSPAENLAMRLNIPVHTFDVIYKLTEWLQGVVVERTPSVDVEEESGKAKILKTFSKTRDKQIVGGRVENGVLESGSSVKIMRRDSEVGRGRIRELQKQKQKTGSVSESEEFGAMIESKIEIAPGDRIEAFVIVQK